MVREVIRGFIGFQGLLMSDDISMGALSGTIAERSRAALAAGCDIVLHCNGDLAEMTRGRRRGAGAGGRGRAARRAPRWRSAQAPEEFDVEAAREIFTQMMAGDAGSRNG